MSLRERLRTGEWVAIISSSILVISVFLGWYNCSYDYVDETTLKHKNISVSGWDGTKLSLLIIISAFTVIAIVLLVRAGSGLIPATLPFQVIVTTLGFGAFVIVVLKLFLHDSDLGLSYGIFISLASSVGVIVGGIILSKERYSGSADGKHGDGTRRLGGRKWRTSDLSEE